jgi:hypothetical protein
MLDECKGERLEEVLAVFSNVVLKKVLEGSSEVDRSIAKELALENFSYTGERTVLSALILAHKASLSRHLREKGDARARYLDFADLLNLNERRIARRHEQLKEVIGERGLDEQISHTEVGAIQHAVQRNWSGNDQWLDTILYGDISSTGEGLLATRFDKVWKHVESGTIGDVEGENQAGLIEQLEARVRDQENRLARWQDFGRTLNKGGISSPSKKSTTRLGERKKIDLRFNQHEALQIGRSNYSKTVETVAASLEDYNRLIDNMKTELANVGKPQFPSKRAATQSLTSERRQLSIIVPAAENQDDPQIAEEDEWSSASETEETSPGFTSFATKSTSRTPSSEAPANETSLESKHDFEFKKPALPNKVREQKDRALGVVSESVAALKERPPSPLPISRTPPLEPLKPTEPIDHEAELADQILNSMSAASPSPKKRHTLSLAERTRLSMSRNSHSQFSDLHDEFEIAELPRLSIKPRHSLAPKTSTEDPESQKHADLIERTRKSMAGFEAAQKKAQLERRRSMKDEKKKQRQSSYFPKVEEEAITPDISAIEMMEGDPDYESVFKSRPKIKTSPAVSPTRIWEDEEED